MSMTDEEIEALLDGDGQTVEALLGLCRELAAQLKEAHVKPAPPVINVQPASVTLGNAAAGAAAKAPTTWNCVVTERDKDKRISRIQFTAYEGGK